MKSSVQKVYQSNNSCVCGYTLELSGKANRTKLGDAYSAQGQMGKTAAKLEHHVTLRSAKTNIDFCPKDRRQPKTRPTTRGQKPRRNRAELGEVGKQTAERCGELSVEVLGVWWAGMSSSV